MQLRGLMSYDPRDTTLLQVGHPALVHFRDWGWQGTLHSSEVWICLCLMVPNWHLISESCSRPGECGKQELPPSAIERTDPAQLMLKQIRQTSLWLAEGKASNKCPGGTA